MGAIGNANQTQGGANNVDAMNNGQAQYVGDQAIGNQVNLSGSTGTDPVQIRTLNDVEDSAIAMDEGQAMRNSDGSQQQSGTGNSAANNNGEGFAQSGIAPRALTTMATARRPRAAARPCTMTATMPPWP